MKGPNRFRFRCYVPSNPPEDRFQFITLERGAKLFWPAEVPDIVLDQSTGLLDSKGVEIFEGDITQIVTEDDGNNVFNRHVVKWDAEEARFRMMWGKPSHAEVIGNIHEHPELLK